MIPPRVYRDGPKEWLQPSHLCPASEIDRILILLELLTAQPFSVLTT